MQQDLYGQNIELETEYDHDWRSAQQAYDDAEEQRAVAEAYERIYLAIGRLEVMDNCEYTGLRADVRLTEMVAFRGK